MSEHELLFRTNDVNIEFEIFEDSKNTVYMMHLSAVTGHSANAIMVSFKVKIMHDWKAKGVGKREGGKERRRMDDRSYQDN